MALLMLQSVATDDPDSVRSDPATLTMAPDEVRRLGYRIVDALVDHLQAPGDEPLAPTSSLHELAQRLGGPPPAAPADAQATLETLLTALRHDMHHNDHPRFFARVAGPSSAAGALGDMAATAFNAPAMSESSQAATTALEAIVLRWLAELLGLPAETEGILLSGGSMSSLTALATARHALLGGHDPAATVYVSDQTHSSLLRALHILGFGPDRIRILPTDSGFRLPVAELAEAVAADRRIGLRPLCVIATAGTTNTGSIDPLDPIADVAAAEGMWVHVDGAYGVPAAMTDRARPLFDGLARADSVTLDPHKWLFAPYEISALLVRHPGALEATFSADPEYLRDTATGLNFRNRGPQLSRETRAVKLWMIFKLYGVAALQAAIERGIANAELAEAQLRSDPDWEIVSPAQLAIVCFAHRRVDADTLLAATVADGYSHPGSTVLRGRTVLRLCTINPRTTPDEIDTTVRRMAQLARV